MDEDFFLVLGSDGSPQLDEDGDILVQRARDRAQFFVAPGLIGEWGNIGESSVSHPHQETIEPLEEPVDEDDSSTKQWTKVEIEQLIDLYKEHKKLFASTTVKNIKVWQKIAQILGNHSAKQCENKFKYLKGKYLKKKDNMSNQSSGARHIHFEFFEKMDEVFCREPIVQPVAIASSSRENNMEELSQTPIITPIINNMSDTTQTNSGTQSRKNILKEHKLKEALHNLNIILKDAEAEKQKRHAEVMQLQKENMAMFADLMSKILEKM